jgi:hypothetical protein
MIKQNSRKEAGYVPLMGEKEKFDQGFIVEN